MFPRDSAGSFQLQGGNGDITGMVSCGDFLEIYKKDKTFRVITPASVDPGRTNPKAPWVISPVSNIGSEHPIVARFFIQSVEMLNMGAFKLMDDSAPVKRHLHSCKETLLKCYSIATDLVTNIDTVVNEINSSGLRRENDGRAINPFPVVENLERDCSEFLVQANRAIKKISSIPHHLLELDSPDNNFDKLARSLSSLLGESSPFPTYVRKHCDQVRYIVELRNFDEHPGEKRTVVKNLHVLPNGKIQAPTICLEGEDSSQEYFLSSIPLRVTEYLTVVAEHVVIHSVINGLRPDLPFVVQSIPDSEIDGSKPVRFRLTMDLNRVDAF